jgi:phosphonate transport system substrate-binding protein
MKLIRLLILLAVSMVLFSKGVFAQEGTVYSLAIVPQSQAIQTARDWMLFVKKVSQDAGITLQITTYYSSLPEFEASIKSGVPDFAYMNPYTVVMAHREQKYLPLISDKTPLVGVLVVHKNKNINSVQDLNGQVLAFPAVDAFGASLYMRALLTNKEHVHFTPKYVQNHDNVYWNVILDKVAAGGGVMDTLNRQPESVRNQLKIIYQTPPTSSHALVAHPRVPEAVRQKVVDAILKFEQDTIGKSVLKQIQIDQPVTVDYQKDYAPLAKLGLEKFMKESEER